uniref:B1937_F2_40 n=1 Tax=Mycobacterium leprae TaxID=1769 RepID=Q49758_MYCLR|nr:B1937_F2_40 [Mycobacterium leprae]CAB16145.1 hypothetical protein MLCL536.02c [Mycobacterium leprae]
MAVRWTCSRRRAGLRDPIVLRVDSWGCGHTLLPNPIVVQAIATSTFASSAPLALYAAMVSIRLCQLGSDRVCRRDSVNWRCLDCRRIGADRIVGLPAVATGGQRGHCAGSGEFVADISFWLAAQGTWWCWVCWSPVWRTQPNAGSHAQIIWYVQAWRSPQKQHWC